VCLRLPLNVNAQVHFPGATSGVYDLHKSMTASPDSETPPSQDSATDTVG
jgi:hypothetical protein